ncbi:ATP-binding cassette domain-containing protein [Christensenella timonensis]|uniref:ATP-binding cassette domain-containing protein n=1 Tax=Christensenella timonensis TaxID=1816678 RepID=UPI0008373B1A|nr:ATP-binding cassette domain-containing protein [Christensenella timonensis]
MLTIEHLEVTYKKRAALSITHPITIKKSDRIGIIGSNGAGKTTLLKSVLGLTRYTGRISTRLRPEDIAAHMQQNNYVKTMPVRYIMETILGTGIKNDRKLQGLVDFFDFGGCLNKRFQILSGGEKQRFTIILVLMQDAPLTFFDEVTSGLDFETRQKLMDKLASWYTDKTTALCIVSHYYDELERIADKLLILEDGFVVDFGSTHDLFSKYCGNAIMTIENTQRNRVITKGFPTIESPRHLLSFSCPDEAAEAALSSLLIRHDINYKRSNQDIESIFTNAVKHFYEAKGETV